MNKSNLKTTNNDMEEKMKPKTKELKLIVC